MQRWILPVTATALLIAPAFAQNRPLACQADESAGLNWVNGRWEVARFNPEPAKFILVQTGDSLSPESVAKVLHKFEMPKNLLPTCRRDADENLIFCVDGIIGGKSLLFSFRTMKGSHAALFGSISANQQYRDSVAVITFTCQPF